MVMYGVATLTFFSVAAVITVVGIQDLKSLLSRANRKGSRRENDTKKNS